MPIVRDRGARLKVGGWGGGLGFGMDDRREKGGERARPSPPLSRFAKASDSEDDKQKALFPTLRQIP